MPATLLERLREATRRNPAAIAFAQGETRVSYGGLWSGVLTVAARLEDLGIGRGEQVALLSENSPAYAAAYYGVLHAGAVVVALNSQARARDLCAWIDHSRAAVLLADTEHGETERIAERLPDLRIEALDMLCADALQRRALPVEGSGHGADATLASIIYTSGTTGAPKGVMLSQANLASNVAAIINYLELDSSDSILNVLPFTYSYGNSVLHTHLAVGARIVLQNTVAFPRQTLELMAAERVTGFSGVPSTFAFLLNRVQPEDYDLSELRYVTQAGGPMSRSLITSLRSALPSTRVFVMYGQTEATARLSYLSPDDLEARLGSVGKPLDGVSLEIRMKNGDTADSCEVGEIWVQGPNVMLGYWRDDTASSSVLVDGWLKTGDLGHKDVDGYLHIDGRITDMIKTGAHRVSPADVEEAIAELDGVDEVAVVGVDDELLGQAIHAWVVRGLESLTERDVFNHCRQNLALYKLPKKICFLDQLPKTASGKVQRHRLLESMMETRRCEDE
jgi:acyl-CoA synthetase (AMP-forming)/AMP-acid ligase II